MYLLTMSRDRYFEYGEALGHSSDCFLPAIPICLIKFCWATWLTLRSNGTAKQKVDYKTKRVMERSIYWMRKIVPPWSASWVGSMDVTPSPIHKQNATTSQDLPVLSLERLLGSMYFKGTLLLSVLCDLPGFSLSFPLVLLTSYISLPASFQKGG